MGPLDVTGRPVALRALDLDRFFAPRAIAVVGASDTPGSAATMNYRMLKEWEAAATIYPVNPNRDTVNGERCYRSILDVPGDVDVAVILAASVEEGLKEVVEKKVAFAVVFGAGFGETGAGGKRRQKKIEELLRGSDTRLLGPNTALNAFQPFRDALPGKRIALVTQSGQQGRPIYQAQDIGIALSHWAPTGNEADLESADFIRYFADQDEVGVIAAYLEGLKNGRTFMLAADHAARKGVPIVAVKVGRTEVGRSWAQSHSAHLAGSDAVTSAVFRQLGVTRADTMDELLDVSMMFARCDAPVTDGVCVYAISGGTGAHVADLAAGAGLRLPVLGRDTQRKLRQWIPSYLRVSNPVDCGGHPAGDERGRKILDTLLDDPRIGVLVVPVAGSFAALTDRLAEDLVGAASTTGKPVCVVWGSPAADEDAYRKVLLRSQLPVFRSVRNCLTAVKAYLDYHEFRGRYRPFKPVLRPSRARPKLGRGTLDEHRSKELLRAYGIPVTRDELCSSAAEAVRAAERIGFPVVMKACGPGLAHKTALGLVRVGVGSAREVRSAFAELSAHEGVLVCEQVSGGVETVVGVSHDEIFGPVVMFGLGGVAVEVLRDVTFRLPPFDRAEARRMIGEVRCAPLLEGADKGALVAAIMKVQRLAQDLSGELRELDVNPLLARPDGVVALDALAVSG